MTRYRFDPERRERLHVVVATLENDEEFSSLIDTIQADINRRTEAASS